MIRNKRGSLQPNKNSLVLDLKPILAARSIAYSTTYLTKIGLNNVSVGKMLKGEAVQINLKQLTTLCTHLNCTPNDLFSLREMHLETNHQLLKLRTLGDEVLNPLSVFEGKSMDEIETMLEELKEKE